MRAAHDVEGYEIPLYTLGRDGETLFRVETTGDLINRWALGKRVKKNGYDSDESVSQSRPAVAAVWRSQ